MNRMMDTVITDVTTMQLDTVDTTMAKNMASDPTISDTPPIMLWCRLR